MPFVMIELSVVLPAYEEAANLDQLLPALNSELSGLGIAHEIVVVDSAEPRDETPAVCHRHGARHIPRVGGSLYGHAIRTAQREARGRHIVLMDADGSHGPAFVRRLWEHRDTADLLIASRYVSGGQTENPAILIFMSMVVNHVFRLCLGLRCADVSNSFRLYRGDDFRALELVCENFDIVEEILIKLCFSRKEYTVKELPFTFEKRKAGKTKRKLLLFAIGYLQTLARLHRFKRSMRRTSPLKNQ
jgi:dolichol-phosphate mannosyltransferase